MGEKEELISIEIKASHLTTKSQPNPKSYDRSLFYLNQYPGSKLKRSNYVF
jgi:hypothetical protein